MPKFGPISRRDLLFYLKKAGFVGPVPGTKHGVVVRGEHKVVIPNPHGKDIGQSLLKQILREAEISRAEWEQL
jgi:predicted RNA binding protein YcfA (HicA-like mRNA interferase family)